MSHKSSITVSLKCLIMLSSLLISFASLAEQPKLLSKAELEQVKTLREQANNSNLGYEILESLTTEIGPRMAGSPQDLKAVEWAINKMKSLGFDKVWKEPVTYSTWLRGVETFSVLSPFPQSMHITALGGSVATPSKGMQAEIVHLKDLDALKKANKADIEGKIVFISNRMERFRDGRGYGKAVVARSNGAVEASKKGALAIVIRSIGTDNHRVPHTGMMRYKDNIKKIPAAALSNPDADQLVRMLRRGKPVKVNLNIGSHPAEDFNSYNVIGEMTGSTAPNEYIIMGGHLDSWDLGTGAIDDGAGVSLTMAAAALIKKSGIKHRRTIRVIAWANEEQGLKGAFQYAKAHQKDFKQHIIGSESDFGADRIYEFSTIVTPKDVPFMDQMAKMLKPLGIARGNNQAKPDPDLIPLDMKGMPILAFAQDGTRYFDLHHTADDTLDKVEPKALAQNVAAYTVYVLMTSQYESDLPRPKTETKKGH